MADENKPEQKAAEDLTPTPTQAEMDEIMAKLMGLEAPAKHEVREVKEVLPPTMTQAENDAAIKAAAPGEFPEGSTDPQTAEREAKRKKEMEAEQHGGYQTRAVKPTK